MIPPSIDALKGWHDFYAVIGTASATLLGAMFVVASIGSGYLTQERSTGISAFLTPTVIHMASVVGGCALALVPSLDWRTLATLYGFGSFCGLVYSLRVGLRVGQHQVDLSDRLWYAGVPVVAYSAILVAAAMVWSIVPASLDALAVGLALLLAAGIRNSWDMLIFIVVQEKGPN